VSAMDLKEEDFVEHLFVASSKDTLLVFTNEGKVYPLKTYEIPQGSRASKGRAIVNLLHVAGKERVTTVLSIKEFDPNKYILMTTHKGMVKRCSLDLFAKVRKNGIAAIGLGKEDHLVEVVVSTESDEVLLATQKGLSIRFKVKEVRPTGRQSQGVRGIRLAKGDCILGTVLFHKTLTKKDVFILTATGRGFAKRTPINEYRLQSRSGKGVINVKLSAKLGEVVGVVLVGGEDEVMCITQKGILIRTKVKNIRVSGRSTQGVRIINLGKQDKLSSIARIISEE